MVSSLSLRIKEKTRELGFQKVGITDPVFDEKQKEELEEWISKGHHASMEWIVKRKDERGNVFEYFPEVKSIISVGMNYNSGFSQDDLKSDYKISQYAWGDDYHDYMKSKLFHLLAWLKEEVKDVKGIVCVDTSPLMEKPLAQKAGLGWQGKHTNLITRDYGSWIFLGAVLLDIPLDYDKPFMEDLCGSCTACLDACPTHALEENKIDARKCISYLSIEHRGDFPKHQNQLDDWIYGCDICQDVCPWNQKFSVTTDVSAFQPRKDILEWANEDWHQMDEENFRQLFKKSPVKRTKFVGLKRNIEQNRLG
ncbi:MAG: tRNA epoxyqueuosine(34) reductase QueG [Candidatus Marinimicrobia bacterium]|jgi:epoxyqueuosine reductase|nr:tRNA epoxyqueuosine(34) reductase QueG [Candidatus Neomarinimicrobiota bacterium]MBT3496168.1 tRNA epoxyqueuosine(34) reductase QueG [Candidatus Neomarinimicrobiota bacterium]MBT3692806.1 tRNA epoxyqueuosine(34) reductase QueG [Candidatus Neomarinimicrobiota bacterium]MBT3731839.1 tRNA epoxyqueuosine(34) reductase QueG [Candidatus Neomarinimicrobiota bacterium]MBT4145072.1 tRNA epoxyqueuosine(34) reductase QueG [Candidatus Neomarinimicrobiota bacterium]